MISGDEMSWGLMIHSCLQGWVWLRVTADYFNHLEDFKAQPDRYVILITSICYTILGIIVRGHML